MHLGSYHHPPGRGKSFPQAVFFRKSAPSRKGRGGENYGPAGRFIKSAFHFYHSNLLNFRQQPMNDHYVQHLLLCLNCLTASSKILISTICILMICFWKLWRSEWPIFRTLFLFSATLLSRKKVNWQ